MSLAREICEFLSKNVYGENNPNMFELQIKELDTFLESQKPGDYGYCGLCGSGYETDMGNWNE